MAAPIPVLSDGVVLLRPPREEDLPDVVATCQDPEFARWTLVPVPYEPPMAREYVLPKVDPDTWWENPYWVVTVVPDDRFCGAIDLRPDGAGGADVGYGLSPWARGHGHMARALRLVVTWALTVHRLEVVTWYALVGNEASRRTAQRAGFRVHDAILRKHAVQRGTRVDEWAGEITAADLAVTRTPAAQQSLTPRELQVLHRLARGESNRAIAEHLGISENTVKNHVRSILEKLPAKTRAEAAIVGLKRGLTTLPG